MFLYDNNYDKGIFIDNVKNVFILFYNVTIYYGKRYMFAFKIFWPNNSTWLCLSNISIL